MTKPDRVLLILSLLNSAVYVSSWNISLKRFKLNFIICKTFLFCRWPGFRYLESFYLRFRKFAVHSLSIITFFSMISHKCQKSYRNVTKVQYVLLLLKKDTFVYIWNQLNNRPLIKTFCKTFSWLEMISKDSGPITKSSQREPSTRNAEHLKEIRISNYNVVVPILILIIN